HLRHVIQTDDLLPLAKGSPDKFDGAGLNLGDDRQFELSLSGLRPDGGSFQPGTNPPASRARDSSARFSLAQNSRRLLTTVELRLKIGLTSIPQTTQPPAGTMMPANKRLAGTEFEE